MTDIKPASVDVDALTPPQLIATGKALDFAMAAVQRAKETGHDLTVDLALDEEAATIVFSVEVET